MCMIESRASLPLRRFGIDRSLGMVASSEDNGLQLLIQLLPVANAGGVEVEQFLKGSVLGAAMAAFKTDDGVVVDSRHLHRSFLRETRSLPQSLHPSTAPLVSHCSQEYHNMSRGIPFPVSSLGLLAVRHHAFLAPLRPWNQRLLAGTVAAHTLGNTSQLVGSLPGYGFIGHRIWCDITLVTCAGPGFSGWLTSPSPISACAAAPHNPTLRDSRISVKKNQIADTPGAIPLGIWVLCGCSCRSLGYFYCLFLLMP